MKKVKINSSFMHMLKARMIHKLGRNLSDDDRIKIIESGKKDAMAFIKLSTGEIFFHRFFKDPLYEVFTRYIYSHYEIDKKPHPVYGIHRNHTDNLLKLKVNEKIRKNLLEKMPIKKDDTVLELGAFCGFGTMKLSKLVGKDGKVIAVEADPTNYKILNQNILANNIENVLTINKGIWSKKGSMQLFKEKNQRNSLVVDLLESPDSNEKIDIDTVDNILSENQIMDIDFVTMEINAAEVEGLKGMKNTLEKKYLRIIAAGWYNYEGKPEWQLMKTMLENNGFQVFIGVQNRVFAIKG